MKQLNTTGSREESEEAETNRAARSASQPLTLLSATRSDPFQSLAKQTTSREDFLSDYYVGDLVDFYLVPPKFRFNPMRDACFKTIIQHPAAFYAMLSFASLHLAIRRGQDEPQESQKYRVMAVSEVRKLVADPEQRSSDFTIMALAGILSYHADMRVPNFPEERLKEVQIQYEGLHTIISNHGGFCAFSARPAISWIVNWYDLQSLGALSWDTTPLSEHAFLPPSKLSLQDAVRTGDDSLLFLQTSRLAQLVEEYVGLYGSLYRVASERYLRTRLGNNSSYELIAKISIVLAVFLQGDLPYRQDFKAMVVFYLNVLIYDHRDSLRPLFERLSELLHRGQDGSMLSPQEIVGSFLWPLITNPQTRQIESLPRMWTTSRALRVFSQMSPGMQGRTKIIFTDFLRAEKLDPRAVSPTPEEYRGMVMEDLKDKL